MKLTWFGGTTLRVHIGGRILVCGPAAVAGIAPAELLSGADRHVAEGAELGAVNPRDWQPRRPRAVIEQDGPEEVLVHRLAQGALLVDAVGEPPLVLLEAPLAAAGRWMRDSVIVAFTVEAAASALSALGPRLVALALPAQQVDASFEALEAQRDGAGLVALERGMALEV